MYLNEVAAFFVLGFSLTFTSTNDLANNTFPVLEQLHSRRGGLHVLAKLDGLD